MRTAYRWTGVAAIAVAFGCGGGDGAEDMPETAQPEATAASTGPDTTEGSLWAHLQTADYRSWGLWPGRGELYAGGEPHGMLLTTYVNEVAMQALTSGQTPMPAGAIVVKENFMPDSTLAAVTAMHKMPGYDAANGDWFWAKWAPDGVVDVAGRVAACASCHAVNASGDYLRTPRPGQ